MNNYIYKAYKAGKLLVQLKKGHDKRKERVRKDLERYGNEVLNSEEMSSLVDRLFTCSTPNYTPDGQLVLHIIPESEIEHLFSKWLPVLDFFTKSKVDLW